MRAFNELVFDQTVRGTTAEVFSAATWDEVLGRADALVYEIEVEEASGSTPTLTVRHHHSCSGKGFVPLADLVTTASLSTLPVRSVVAQVGPLAGLGRVGVSLGAASGTPVARVRIWATGRVS